MKILLVSPYLPHPGIGHGGGLVIYNLLRHLGPRHDVTLLCFVRNDEERALASDVAGFVRAIHVVQHDVEHISKRKRLLNLLSPRPSFTIHAHHPAFSRKLVELVQGETFDIVQIEYLFLADYAREIRHPRLVLDLIECFGRHWRGRIRNERFSLPQAYFLFDWWKAERFERSVLDHFRRVFTLTSEDCAWLLARRPDLPVHVRLPGVDIPPLVRPVSEAERSGILFVGSFKHPANQDGLAYFLRDVWPEIRARRPDARLTVAGEPAPDAFRTVPGVEVLGFVDDLAPLYGRTQVCIAPIRFGGGIKTKVLEALAHEVPVVTTPLGAEGLGATDGDELLVAKGDREFAERVVALLDDPDRARRMGRAGRVLIDRRYRWDPIIEDLERHYRAILGEPAPAEPAMQ